MHVEGGVSGGGIMCFLIPCQKPSPIYHNLTFSDSIQVSQTGNILKRYHALKVRTQRSAKSYPGSRCQKKSSSTSSFISLCVKYFTSAVMPAPQNAKRHQVWDYSMEGNGYQEAASHSSSSSSSSHNCFQGLHRKEPRAVFCLRWTECTGDTLKSKTTPRLGPTSYIDNCHLNTDWKTFLSEHQEKPGTI